MNVHFLSDIRLVGPLYQREGATLEEFCQMAAGARKKSFDIKRTHYTKRAYADRKAQ
jgi:hypothetical protein